MRRLFRLAKTHMWTSGTLAATAALAAGLAGCGNDTEGGLEGSTCVSTEEAFAVASFKVLADNCSECHAAGSLAGDTEFVLQPASEAGFLDTNLKRVKNVALTRTPGEDGKSLLLAKPLNEGDSVAGGIAHEGGTIFKSTEEAGWKELEALVKKMEEPESCPNTEARFLSGLQMHGPSGTARKAALVLGARLLTDEEIAAVDAGGWGAVDSLLNTLMQEDAFYARLMEKYNDIMLTDFYLAEDVDVIQDDELGYKPFWYEEIQPDADLIKQYGAQNWDEAQEKMAAWTKYGIARAPIELISHIVKHDKPFTEIVTADYMVVNPFSARAYGVTDAKFANASDPNEFVEARLGGYEGGYPHSGFYSDPMWLNRHPTTPTNRNRHRAKEIYFMVLGNDILKAAERPVSVDANLLADNPTVHNSQCSVCHEQIDPVAGAFRNFQYAEGDDDDSQHHYRPDFEWYAEMAQTGFLGDSMPANFKKNANQWLGTKLANDNGFAYGAVFMAYRTITGNEPLQPPSRASEHFDDELTAFLGQYYTFTLIANNFRNNGYSFKAMVKELVMSPYFRAMNTAKDIDPQQLSHLAGVGTAHFLTPEQLNRKIENVLGLRWTGDGEFGRPNLLNSNDNDSQAYQILFGGIDSVNTTVRVKEPSGIMSNVVERMGLEVGCKVIHAEFSLLAEERRFLKNVDLTTEPADANGYEVPDAVGDIKKDIVFLHQRLLGERLELTDPEIARTYQLFYDVWKQGKADIAGGTTLGEMPGECVVDFNYTTGASIPEEQIWRADGLYTGRAWSAVLAYLVTDFNFVYEQ